MNNLLISRAKILLHRCLIIDFFLANVVQKFSLNNSTQVQLAADYITFCLDS